MTEFQNYLHLHFNISADDSKKIAASFNTETLRKGDYFLRSGAHRTHSARHPPIR